LSSMTIYEVMERLPHRYPFLLIDRVLECVPGDRLTAIKNVTFNEPFFTGHFPVRPVMPGVLILEAMAQATGILAFRTMDEGPDSKSLYLLVGLDKARFKRQVEPGDQLKIEVDLKRRLRGVWIFGAEARVGDEIAATADVMCSRQDINA
jgi:3-hydroxyacyl-[acyl-carrier-protein] dehydratase